MSTKPAPFSRRRPRAAFLCGTVGPILLTALALCPGLLGGCGPGGGGQADAAPSAGCVLGEFDCLTGTECVDSETVCDGTEDCSNGRDEADCGCGAGRFTCNDGQCIHAAFVCDHVVNCNDGSDEVGCP